MASKFYTKCNIEKIINNFYKKYTECRDCNNRRSLKRYFEKREKISNQQRYIMRKIEINYYRNNLKDIYNLKNLRRNYVELENRLKALEEKTDKN